MSTEHTVPIVFVGEAQIDVPDEIDGQELTEAEQSKVARRMAAAFALVEGKVDSASLNGAADEIEEQIDVHIDDEELHDMAQTAVGFSGRWDAFNGKRSSSY